MLVGLFVMLVAGTWFGATFNPHQYVNLAIGFPLGIALFGALLAILRLWEQKNPSYVSLRNKYSPAQRNRYGIVAIIVLAVILLTTNQVVPTILGGAFLVAFILFIYNFMRRTREEIIFETSGEIDPRDEAYLAKRQNTEEEVDDEQSAELIELLNSLPEDKRAMLLDPKLTKGITFAVQDDKKKKRRFGRK